MTLEIASNNSITYSICRKMRLGLSAGGEDRDITYHDTGDAFILRARQGERSVQIEDYDDGELIVRKVDSDGPHYLASTITTQRVLTIQRVYINGSYGNLSDASTLDIETTRCAGAELLPCPAERPMSKEAAMRLIASWHKRAGEVLEIIQGLPQPKPQKPALSDGFYEKSLRNRLWLARQAITRFLRSEKRPAWQIPPHRLETTLDH